MIKVVAFDFDGVILDSAHDNFIMCQKILEKRGEKLEDSDEIRFRKGRNFLRAIGGLYPVVEFIKQNKNFDRLTQEDIDNFISEHKSESRKFSEEFFALRKKMQDEDYDKWFALNKIFPGIRDIIARISKKFQLVVISTKDSYSIATIMKRFGISIEKNNIFSKEISENKAELVKMVSEKFSVNPNEIFFIDDQPKHLELTKELGTRTALAGWGYNNDRQKSEARQLGIPIIDKPEELEELIKTFD